MARRVTRMGRTAVRRKDGVIEIRRSRRWRSALAPAAEAAFLLVPLLFALAFVLPPALLPVPPLVLAAGAWLLFHERRPAAPTVDPSARHVISLRSARARGRGSAPRS